MPAFPEAVPFITEEIPGLLTPFPVQGEFRKADEKTFLPGPPDICHERAGPGKQQLARYPGWVNSGIGIQALLQREHLWKTSAGLP